MTEYFDVVDEQDRPTGQKTTKAEAHKQGILHRVAAVFVFDKQGRLYVQDHKKLGLFDHSVGGHVTAGEDYQTAAYREANEELNLVNQSLKEVLIGCRGQEMDPNSTLQHMFGIYECHPDDTWAFTPNEEVESIHPEPVDSLVGHMLSDPNVFTSGFLTT